MTSEFRSVAREFRDAFYEALAGVSTAAGDADPLLALEELSSEAARLALNPPATALIESLNAVASSTSLEAAVATAFQRFDLPDGFREAIYFARCLQRDAGAALSLLSSRAYVESANVPPSLLDLSTDRRAVLDAATFASLWQDEGRTAWLHNTMALWKRDFLAAYVSHHCHFRDEVATVAERVEATVARAAALERLNTLSCLGPPTAAAALGQLRALEACSACSVSLDKLTEALQVAPACPVCRFELVQAEPVAETHHVVQAIERGLATRQARLARRLASCISGRPAGDNDERLERFVQAVQAAGLDGLALVLDDPLIIEFIRDLLDAPAVDGVLTQMAHSYPEVTVANLDDAVSESHRLLETGAVQQGAVRLQETRA
jgi:hypothetical protein